MVGNKNFKILLFWFLFGTLFLSGVGISVYFSLEPRTLPKIKLSGVATPKGFSDAVHLRLFQELQNVDILFIGVGIEEDHRELAFEIIKNFQNLHTQEKIYLFIDQQLAEIDGYKQNLNLWSHHETNDISLTPPEVQFISLVQQVHEVFNAERFSGKKIILAPNIYTTQTLKDGPLRTLKNKDPQLYSSQQVLSLSLSFFPSSREEEKKVSPPCLVDQFDQQGTGAFGCMILQSSRPNYRRKKPETPYLGFLQQTGESDYLLLFKKQTTF